MAEEVAAYYETWPAPAHDGYESQEEEHSTGGSSTVVESSSTLQKFVRPVLQASIAWARLFIVVRLEEHLEILVVSQTFPSLVLTILALVGMQPAWLLHATWRRNSYRIVIGTYIRAGFLVLEAYALLLAINIRYIRIAIIPVILLVFIGALCSKFGLKASLRHGSSGYIPLRDHTVSSMKKMNIRSLSYLLQQALLIRTRRNGSFVMAHFLLFFSTALSALPEMIASLPAEASPGVAHVLPVLHRTCIALMVITVHATAAKWLGEDFVLVCTPELVAILIWFTVCHGHGARYTARVHSLTSRISGLYILSSAIIVILAYLQDFISSNDTEVLASLYSRVFWISSSSLALSYYSVWMLEEWPGKMYNSKGLLMQLIKFCANVFFGTTVLLAIVPVGHWVLNKPKAAYLS